LSTALFRRPAATYQVHESVIHSILHDECNPTKRVASAIRDGATVLDVGAGNGMLPIIAHRLGKRATFDGIEPDPNGVEVARTQYRHLHAGYLEDCPFTSLDYDYIVCGDVVEHTVDPQEFLDRVLTVAGPTTKIFLSLPNVAFAAIRAALLEGRFDYVDSGLLERTHLRFFTLETLRSLVSRASLNIDCLYLLQRDPFDCEIRLDKSAARLIRRLAQDELALTYQFLVELGRHAGPTEKVVVPPRTRRWEPLWNMKTTYWRVVRGS
jgi:2-polyprenyl-3-methyl-5-hydroxy-6-metoxy-1,4-benzoquinol methylase